MTLLDVEPIADGDVIAVDTAEPGNDIDESLEELRVGRPLAVAALSAIAAATMTGGVFGSWSARTVASAAALAGVASAWLVLRSARRTIVQVLFLTATLLIALLSAVPGSGGATPLDAIGDAVQSGRLLRPPVPFDPGWRPVIVFAFVMVGFSAAWLGAALRRPLAGWVLPLPILAITAISQPADAELIAALLGGAPMLAAVAIIFGGDPDATQLSRQFELKRLVKGAAAFLVAVVALVFAAQTSFLFPEPVYDPTEQPQKPRSVPLSEAVDRVLFEVDATITGPWRIGVLDVYDGTSWRLPPFDPQRVRELGNGVLEPDRSGETTVRFTVRDLGNTSTLPTVALPAAIDVDTDGLVYDPRTETVRVTSGRVAEGLTYSMTLPAYPTGAQLEEAPPVDRDDGEIAALLEIPDPPPAVAALLATAPDNPWLRLDFLRSALNEVVIAAGAGTPTDIRPDRVDDLLTGDHEGTPFEIVAAEAMLARWAGVPARIGFGFDGVNAEDGRFTVRPKNAAQFLEVYFEGFGWLPIIGTPPRAKQTLDADDTTRVTPTVEPSDEVGIELYIPIELDDLVLLYERIRDLILRVLPFALALGAAYLATPWLQKQRRLARRRRWAASKGCAAEIAVEYAEMRELATDLGVGDPFATPLEFLTHTVDDDEHAELAWLMTRAIYDDLDRPVTDDDVVAGRAMAESLRRRMFRAQPFQVKALGLLSRASLAEPYSVELPNVGYATVQSRRRSRPFATTGRTP